MYQNAAILAGFLLIYSAVAGRVERSWLSGPIVFIAGGLLLGPYGLGLVRLNLGAEGLRTLAELTLAMVCSPMRPTRILTSSGDTSASPNGCC
jgi:sodium/hydrogen antiporter